MIIQDQGAIVHNCPAVRYHPTISNSVAFPSHFGQGFGMLLASLLAMLLVNLGLSLEAGGIYFYILQEYHGRSSMTHDTM